jgi:predicted ribonuclease YlaK
MKRASKIFRGTEVYGEVELQQIHRSRIAEIAEKL